MPPSDHLPSTSIVEDVDGVGEASAPASSANLGPGFDCLAVAIDLRCRVRARQASEWSVHHENLDGVIDPADDAVLAAAKVAVGDDRPLALSVSSDIPIARGLGSSSAAHVAGALAAWRAYGEDHPIHRLFEIVAAMEGHPDNAAAAVYGGLVLSTARGRVERLPWNPSLHPLIAVPDGALSTRAARAVLPEVYRADEVIRSVARMGALVAGILTADPVLLAEAAGDEIHESHRQAVWPEVAGVIGCARAAGAVHAAWSGAGPSVLALVTADRVDVVRSALETELGSGGRVLDPGVATAGAV